LVFATILVLDPRIADIPPLLTALAFGVIASSTAPAGTIAVLHQYRARGPLTTTLLGVVALDDALGIILFALVLAASASGSLVGNLGSAVLSIVGALALGLAAGKGLALTAPHARRAVLRLPIALGAILLVVGIAEVLGLSSLLAAMALGFFARHFSRASADRIFGPIEFLEEAVFVVFFTVAGAHFEPAVFLNANYIALMAAYFVARIAGKILGAWLGARLAGAPDPVVRWLGLGLVPQAGVAIGLALLLSHTPAFAAGSRTILNVILGTTVLYEILGPLTTRLALQRAGEMGTARERKGRRS
jgi:Kef-type K+ transport system membrane component KefB